MIAGDWSLLEDRTSLECLRIEDIIVDDVKNGKIECIRIHDNTVVDIQSRLRGLDRGNSKINELSQRGFDLKTSRRAEVIRSINCRNYNSTMDDGFANT